ncbi:ABC transporter permease [Brevibacillus massiliensis]|jgi:spermidine/putrescine transport system permease protein|uniref:ABC transporter permease n=1 Tax=Brevibacillus massiliensis TaxID=1118054 RepID=UPI0002D9A0A9|nr:ABC transporter permease [Brevibacillus massiliensis]
MFKRISSWLYILLIFLFLYTPIAVLVLMSFNESPYNSLPFTFSTKWYSEMAHNQRLIDSTLNSVYIASITAVISVVVATALMLGAAKASPKVKSWVDSVIILPLTVPWLILGLSLLLVLKTLGLDRNFVMLLIGHVVVSLPYAVMVLKARMDGMDHQIEEASYSLGANEWTTFIRITLPMLFPAIIAGAFLAFMISFDNFILSYFLIPIGSSTLPIEIYSSVKFGFTPEINAVSTLILTGTLLLLFVIVLLMRSSLKSMMK